MIKKIKDEINRLKNIDEYKKIVTVLTCSDKPWTKEQQMDNIRIPTYKVTFTMEIKDLKSKGGSNDEYHVIGK